MLAILGLLGLAMGVALMPGGGESDEDATPAPVDGDGDGDGGGGDGGGGDGGEGVPGDAVHGGDGGDLMTGGAGRDVVLLNAAAVLVTAEIVVDLPAGLRRAAEAIDSGAVTGLVASLADAG